MKRGGTISGRHYQTGEGVQVTWSEGLVSSVEPASQAVDPDVWLAPALVDPQINGFAGVDFQSDALRIEHLEFAARQLQACGCSRFFLTLITDHWPQLMQRLQKLRRWRVQSPLLKQTIAGWHVEGPFLASEPGFHGAHSPQCMIDPTPEHIAELKAQVQNDRVLLTLAPERPGSIAVIKAAVARGFAVSLGHTNASADILAQALAAGARGFTHLANACPQLLDRHDNILWRVLDRPGGLFVGLINDRIHVSPPLFRLIHRLLAPENIYYTTDAMAAAGAPPGRYNIGQLELEVGKDGIVRQPGKTNFAGSSLRPLDGVFRAAEMLGRPWNEVWNFISVNPARFLGLGSGLAAGSPAHLCHLRFSKNAELPDLNLITPDALDS